SASSNGGST
ncbi:unnamed protein product, partial [Rotaria sp. Silwood1]